MSDTATLTIDYDNKTIDLVVDYLAPWDGVVSTKINRSFLIGQIVANKARKLMYLSPDELHILAIKESI